MHVVSHIPAALACRTGGLAGPARYIVRSSSHFARTLVYLAGPANPPVLQAKLPWYRVVLREKTCSTIRVTITLRWICERGSEEPISLELT